jgi:TRAP-type C4-dicarboxylate transport system substrate-binding protein
VRLGTLAPQGTSYHRILQQMAERWRTATNGRVQVTVYAGTMGSEAELVRRMRVEQLQAAALTAVGLQEIDPAVNALGQMPMMFHTFAEFEYVRARLEPILTRRLAERGFVVLFWADAGWVRFFTKQPAQRIEDFRRLKVFVTSGETEQFDIMRQSGFQPVSLEWTDALTALRTGMIDAVPTIPYFALSMQFHTAAPYMLAIDWAPLAGATIISRRAWESLPPETQAELREAAAEAGRQFRARGRVESDSAVGAMQRRGLTILPVTPAQEAEWRTAIERLYPRIRGSIVPADMFDEVVRILAEYRSRSGTDTR